jgi:hypothetical protein
MSIVSFNQRVGLEQSKPIDNDLPVNVRTALAYVMVDLSERDYLKGRESTYKELLRTGRLSEADFNHNYNTTFFFKMVEPLQQMDWWRIYIFLERVYSQLLTSEKSYDEENHTWIERTSLAEVQKYFINEINTILAEDNLAYYFADGQFMRRGRAQTQKSFQRMGTVLSNPLLSNVRDHYNKAHKFFDERPEPDVENCVKEAVCALEACLEVLTKSNVSGNFAKAVKQIQEIPPTIAGGMIQLYAYRGDGKGVAHAAPQGSKVTEIEAELVLNLVASHITYLVDLLSQPDEIPF